MILYAFPCDIDIARHFCRKVDLSGAVALILKKQADTLENLLLDSGMRKPFVFNEDFYGKISSEGTKQVLSAISDLGIEHAYFPINDFCGNTAILLSLVSRNVTAVNATSETPIELNLYTPEDSIVSERNTTLQLSVEELQHKIAAKLTVASKQLTETYRGESAGERPTTGIVENAPYDCEVLSRYIHASGRTAGRILEIGCGLGYGAFAVAELNPETEIVAIDYDEKAISIADFLWGRKRLSFRSADAAKLPFEDGSFDGVVCFEVIEHVDNPAFLLGEINRVLKTGGRLIGSTPNYRLYPYRVNKDGARHVGAEDLRRDGIWPWHIQEFDEASIEALLQKSGFQLDGIRYPTFVKGLSILKSTMQMEFSERIEFIADNLKWSAADFSVLKEYCPMFSGYSFIFEALKL